MTTRRALGKGIEALIPQRIGRGREVLEIPLDSIVPNRYQPRKDFADEPFRQLVASVRANGVIQPVIVTKGTEGWELVAGERRWRAAREAGLTVLPAIVREATPTDKLVLALIENLQREDLNPIEKAKGFARGIEEFGVTQEALAARLGMSRPAVANYLRLLSLPEEVVEAIRTERLSFGHAKVLLGLEEEKAILVVARRVVSRGLSVRETEALVRRQKKGVRPITTPRRPAHMNELEGELRRLLATRVTLVSARRGGEIRIAYHSDDELDRLVTIFRTIRGRA